MQKLDLYALDFGGVLQPLAEPAAASLMLKLRVRSRNLQRLAYHHFWKNLKGRHNQSMSEANSSNDEPLSDLHRFQLLVSAIHDYAIYMLDADGRVVSWNAGAQRFKGYSEEEIRGQHFSRFYTAEDRAAAVPEAALKAAAENGKFEAEGWRVRKDGSRFWASVVIDPIRAKDGRLVGFAKVTRDISEKKAAANALQRSEQEFRLLVQGVTDYAIYMLDPQGHITNWNAGARRITGYEKDEVLGRHFSLFYTPEDRASGLPERALKAAATEGRFEHEGWRVRRDGSKFLANALVELIRDTDGNFIGYAKITRDITEKQEAAAALKRTEHALVQAQKMEAIGKLTGGVAHDFNNSLQVIAGNLQLLSREIVGNERAEQRLQGAWGGVSRGAKLASQLLAFGRRQPLEPKVVNLGRFLGATADLYRRTLGEAVEVETVIAGGLWNTSVDVVQIENALLNLAINARSVCRWSTVS